MGKLQNSAFFTTNHIDKLALNLTCFQVILVVLAVLLMMSSFVDFYSGSCNKQKKIYLKSQM